MLSTHRRSAAALYMIPEQEYSLEKQAERRAGRGEAAPLCEGMLAAPANLFYCWETIKVSPSEPSHLRKTHCQHCHVHEGNARRGLVNRLFLQLHLDQDASRNCWVIF